MQAPVTVLQANTRRDTGKKAQYGNIMAGKVRKARAHPPAKPVKPCCLPLPLLLVPLRGLCTFGEFGQPAEAARHQRSLRCARLLLLC